MIGLDPERVLQDSLSTICAVLEEQKHKKQTQPVPISGPELAALMKVGTRVVRGVDWKWGDQVRKSLTTRDFHMSTCTGIGDFRTVIESQNSVEYLDDPKFSDRLVWANCADPDQTALRKSSLIRVFTVC